MKIRHRQENICFVSGARLLPPRVRKALPYPRSTLEKIDGNIIGHEHRNDELWETLGQLDSIQGNSTAVTVSLVKAAKKRGRRRVDSKLDRGRKLVNCNDFLGLTAEAIMGATDAHGEMLHLVKWEGKEEMDLVPAFFMTVKFPHIVLAYYENRIKYLCENSCK